MHGEVYETTHRMDDEIMEISPSLLRRDFTKDDGNVRHNSLELYRIMTSATNRTRGAIICAEWLDDRFVVESESDPRFRNYVYRAGEVEQIGGKVLKMYLKTDRSYLSLNLGSDPNDPVLLVLYLDNILSDAWIRELGR